MTTFNDNTGLQVYPPMITDTGSFQGAYWCDGEGGPFTALTFVFNPPRFNGQVFITYSHINGRRFDPLYPNEVTDAFDVDVSTGSDEWGLAESLEHITNAIATLNELGYAKKFNRD